MGNIAQGRWLRSQYSRVLHLPRDRAGMQYDCFDLCFMVDQLPILYSHL